jgi:hypothetical protein
VEVGFAQQRDGRPRATSILGADQAEQRGKVVARVRMARAEKQVAGRDREAHGVLSPVAHTLGLPLATIGTEQAVVRRDVQPAV